jgi:TRAP-type uncharacterized transport system substrate-binding protein
MNKLIKSIIIGILTFCAGTTFAVAQIKMASGGKGGTYITMANDMASACGSKVTFEVLETGGSMDNMQLVLNKRAQAGIVQFDVMKYLEDKDPGMAQIKVLFPLHQEEVHIVGANTTYKEGGWMGFGAKSVELNTLKDLNGRKVVAWGGSVLSAEYFAFRFKLNYEVIDVSGTKLDEKGQVVRGVKDGAKPQEVAAKMVASGEAHAIFAVGGFPLTWLQDNKTFGKQFKLLSIGSDMADQVAGIYNKAKVTYMNLTNGSAQTVAVPAVVVTRDYRGADRALPLAKLKQCVSDNIVNLRDEGHQKWSIVEPAAKFERWANYEPPAEVMSQIAPAKPAPAKPAPAKPPKK